MLRLAAAILNWVVREGLTIMITLNKDLREVRKHAI